MTFNIPHKKKNSFQQSNKVYEAENKKMEEDERKFQEDVKKLDDEMSDNPHEHYAEDDY